MKLNIKDLTFLIPIRIDSIIRLENILMSIRYLLHNFDTNIMVLEASNYDNGILRKLLDKRVQYIFVEDKDPVFYRTKYLNIMTLKSATPFVGIWDADVIIPKEQIIDSILKLREGYEIAYPYDGHFYDTSDIIREFYLRRKRINIFMKNKDKMSMIYGNEMKGGAMFVNKQDYIQAGMENEKFYGWGPEDWERHARWQILNYKIHCSKGCLFHLTHARGNNSTFRSKNQLVSSNRELFITNGSSKTEIKNMLQKLQGVV
jgi:predicted glycosyltransferase involved in capsule biosynthesis